MRLKELLFISLNFFIGAGAMATTPFTFERAQPGDVSVTSPIVVNNGYVRSVVNGKNGTTFQISSHGFEVRVEKVDRSGLVWSKSIEPNFDPLTFMAYLAYDGTRDVIYAFTYPVRIYALSGKSGDILRQHEINHPDVAFAGQPIIDTSGSLYFGYLELYDFNYVKPVPVGAKFGLHLVKLDDSGHQIFDRIIAPQISNPQILNPTLIVMSFDPGETTMTLGVSLHSPPPQVDSYVGTAWILNLRTSDSKEVWRYVNPELPNGDSFTPIMRSVSKIFLDGDEIGVFVEARTNYFAKETWNLRYQFFVVNRQGQRTRQNLDVFTVYKVDDIYKSPPYLLNVITDLLHTNNSSFLFLESSNWLHSYEFDSFMRHISHGPLKFKDDDVWWLGNNTTFPLGNSSTFVIGEATGLDMAHPTNIALAKISTSDRKVIYSVFKPGVGDILNYRAVELDTRTYRVFYWTRDSVSRFVDVKLSSSL